MSRWIVTFDDPVCADIDISGGKGANLARLTAAGLPVPPGFCVATDAYAAFVADAAKPKPYTSTKT